MQYKDKIANRARISLQYRILMNCYFWDPIVCKIGPNELIGHE